jgi:hypothetical protein
MTLAVGDRIATVGRSTALVTFFEGSELELGQEATIILREVRSAAGGAVHITVEDVLGTTVNRVNAFINPNSMYTVQSPGGQVVALIRGSVVRFTQFGAGGTFVGAVCTKLCEVQYTQQKVCEGNVFNCGVDAKGNVTSDPDYDGGLISREDDRQDGNSDGAGGGTLGGP